MSLCGRKAESNVYFAVFCAAGGMLFTWSAAFDCSFFWATELLGDEIGISKPMLSRRGFGLWTVSSVPDIPGAAEAFGCATCKLYDPELRFDVIDGPLLAARVASMVSALLSLPVTVVTCNNLCCWPRQQASYNYQACLMFLLAALVLLDFVALFSRHCMNGNDCYVGITSLYAIWSIAFWILSAVFLLRSPLREQEADDKVPSTRSTAKSSATMPPPEVTEKEPEDTLSSYMVMPNKYHVKPQAQRSSSYHSSSSWRTRARLESDETLVSIAI